jgi:hypothetical protein
LWPAWQLHFFRPPFGARDRAVNSIEAQATMSDVNKLVRIYTADSTVRVMALVAAGGLTLALLTPRLETVGLLALGWVLYLLEEHFIHRLVFHAPAPKQQFLFDLLYRLHYGHHDQQRSRHLLFTPLWFALPIALVTIAALWLLMPLRDALIAVCGGSVTAYLLFEWFHLTSHFRMDKGRLGRSITRRHARHHNIDYAYWFTVSPGGQLVDSAFGSDPARYSVVPNVLTCGLDPHDPRLLKSRQRYGMDSSLTNSPAASGRIQLEQAL